MIAGSHSTSIHGDTILLDINNDSYSFILADRFREADTDALVHMDAFATRNDPYTSPVWHDLPAIEPAHIALRDIGRFALAFFITGWHFIGRPLAHMIRIGSREAHSANVCHDLMLYAEQVDIFERLSVWLPERGDCLFQSFFLANFLKAAGLTSDWVFAVHLYPFRAHCWLARDDHVIGDSAHRVLAFQPIMTTRSGGTP